MKRAGSSQKKFQVLGEYLFWSYANLQMLHYAISAGKKKYDRVCFMIRSKAYKAYQDGRWNIHDLLNINISKIRNNDFCWYCGCKVELSQLTIDHVFPRVKGGNNDMDNIIMVCKSCNSSKGSMDLLEWYAEIRKEWPPFDVLLHYLKQIYLYCDRNQLLKTKIEDLEKMELPFNWRYIPLVFPQPDECA